MFAIRHDDHSLEIEFIANLQSSVDRAKDIHIQVDMNQSIFPGCLQVFDNRDAGHPHDSCNFSLAFAFHTETARKEGFRTDILRGEDGSLALALKKYGKLRFVTARKARVLTGYGTISADGSLFSSFKKRAIKGLRSFTALFYSKNNYEDEDSNLIK